jgi:acyl carrier protein
MTPMRGIQALETLLQGVDSQVAVLPVEWRRFMDNPRHRALSMFLAEIAGSSKSTPKSAGVAPVERSNFRAELAIAPASRRRQLVATFVRDHTLRTLGMEPTALVPANTPLGEMGLDSLLVVELRNKLGLALGMSLPMTLLFDYPTVDALTDYLLTEVFATDAADGEGPREAVTALPKAQHDQLSSIESIEDLSDEDIDRLLEMDERLKVRH